MKLEGSVGLDETDTMESPVGAEVKDHGVHHDSKEKIRRIEMKETVREG